MTARQPVLADKTEIWGLLWGGASAPVVVAPRSKGGRAVGAYEPHTQWLRSVIVEMRRSGYGCADTFRRLCLVEDQGSRPQSFRVSAETADDIWHEIGADITGRVITFAQFKKNLATNELMSRFCPFRRETLDVRAEVRQSINRSAPMTKDIEPSPVIAAYAEKLRGLDSPSVGGNFKPHGAGRSRKEGVTMAYGQIKTSGGRTINLKPEGWTNDAGEVLAPNSGGGVNALSDLMQRHGMNMSQPIEVFGKGKGYMDAQGIVRGLDANGQEWSYVPGVDHEKTRELQKFNMDMATKQQAIENSRLDAEGRQINNRLLLAQLGDLQGGSDTPPPQQMAAALGVPAAPADPLAGLSRKAREQFQTKMYLAGDKQVAAVEQEARDAQQLSQDAKRFKDLNEKTSTGPLTGSGPVAWVRKLGDADLQEMESISNKLVPQMRQPGSGSTSDFDAKMFAKGTIGIDKDKKANDAIALGMIAKTKLNQDRADFMRAYLEGNGTLRGADQAWSTYANANPIFDPASENAPSINGKRMHWRQFFSGNQTASQQQGQQSGQNRPPLSSFER